MQVVDLGIGIWALRLVRRAAGLHRYRVSMMYAHQYEPVNAVVGPCIDYFLLLFFSPPSPISFVVARYCVCPQQVDQKPWRQKHRAPPSSKPRYFMTSSWDY